MEIRRPRFYVLEIPNVVQYKYAWYEVTESVRLSDDAPRCQVCDGYVGGRKWLPPYEVEIKQPRNIGDFVSGFGGCHFLVSERALGILQSDGMTGILESFRVRIVRMGTTTKSRRLVPPQLFGVYVCRSAARVLYDRMETRYSSKPSKDYCPACGPGGGGERNGIWESFKRVVLNELTLEGKDIFIAANLHGTFLISERMQKAITDNDLTNVKVTPIEDYSISFAG